MPKTNPLISIIIPAKNGDETIDRVLSSIYGQHTSLSYEVLVVDSGSEDNTLDVLAKYPLRLYKILPIDFSHSKTRNLGASLAKASKYLVFLNQDAIPSNDRWLDSLVFSIEFEDGLKAACATELNENEQVFNVSGVAGFLYRNSLTRGIHVIEPHLEKNRHGLPKHVLPQLFPFTTVCAIFDREHFDKHPFDESVTWGEDLHWAVNNSRMGYKAACTSFAQVFHHHDYSHAEIDDINAKASAVYNELFGDDFDADVARLISPVSNGSLLESIDAVAKMQKSLSWRVTRPVRMFGNFLNKLHGRRN